MQKFFYTKKVILFAIVVLAAILRLWNLGNVPPSVSLDEASISYNAHSLLKTGVDEYGEVPILSHRGYDDYRRATYLYLAYPFVALFGLDTISIRLPAVILSILTVWATYFLVKELFNRSSIALLASFFLSISPWHIYISRLGHESNACLAFFIFGAVFFLQGQKSKAKLLLSIVFFTLSMVSYYSGQVFIPLFGLGLLSIFGRNIFQIILPDKKMIIAVIFFIILLLPFLVSQLFSQEALIRYQGTNVFAASDERFYQQAIKLKEAIERRDLIGQIFYNRRLLALQILFEGYISHFRPQWLFSNSLAEPHKVPSMGLLYIWEIPLILVGIAVLLFSRLFDGKAKKFIFLWFFLAPLPAAIATQAPHAMRSYNFLPVWQIFTALGIVYPFYKFSLVQKFKNLFLFVSAVVVFVSLATFYKNYFIVFPQTQSSSFQYALSQAIPFVLANQENYDNIIFSNKDSLYQSYMFFLYHSKYNPARYQNEGGTRSGGYDEIHVFSKYRFQPITLPLEGNALYIGNVSEFPQDAHVLKTFSNLNGKEVIKAVVK